MIKATLAFAILVTATLAAIAIVPGGDSAGPASAGSNGMEAMSIDLDITGNTATEIGARDECIEVSAGDEVTFDITALNIPQALPMVGFGLDLNFDGNNLTVIDADLDFLITSLPNSSIFNATDGVPDSSGTFAVAAVDTGPVPESSESGSGVLARLTVEVAADAAAGGYPLTLSEAAHIAPDAGGYAPQAVFNAQLAVDVDCASLPPPPTPTPAPEFKNGDINCDDNVNAVDALGILRFIAGLNVAQQPECPLIGEQAGAFLHGDINCDGNVNAVDALGILRFIAGLNVSQQPECPPIGQQ